MKNILHRLRLKVRIYRIKRVVAQNGYNLRLDEPKEVVNGPYALIVGVIFVQPGNRVNEVRLNHPDGTSDVVLIHRRPDLIRDLKGVESFGFSAILENKTNDLESVCQLTFNLEGKKVEHAITIEFREKKYLEFLTKKKEKLRAIQHIYQCPGCSSSIDLGRFQCPSCNRSHLETDTVNDFRTDDLRSEIDGAHFGNISSHDYDVKALRLIEKHKDGLILDNGCGFRRTYYENVVNFEIAKYPTTDVLGVGEELPFKDASFDAVFSLSVLEHVRDPFKCVSEIMRVLKPGGDLFVAVPFLQPFHGYPNHYYNMTSSGLKNLFEGKAEIEKIGVSRAGHPLWSMQWMLANYANGLSEKESEAFKKLRIQDIIDPSKVLEEKMLAQLDDNKREELASFNYLLGKKPE